jgi:hypothetical protein
MRSHEFALFSPFVWSNQPRGSLFIRQHLHFAVLVHAVDFVRRVAFLIALYF